MASQLGASVGRKGKNQPDDVKNVQNLLNGFAGKVKFSKLKVDGANSGALEKAIGVFQAEVCGFRPDHRIDPGKGTIKKLTAGPSKAEAERKAEMKKFAQTVEAERKRMFEQIRKVAEKQANGGGLPTKGAEAIFKGVQKRAEDTWERLLGKDPTPDDFDVSEIVKRAGKVVKTVEGDVKNTVKEAVKVHKQAIAVAQEAVAKQAKGLKSVGNAVDAFGKDIAEYADSAWDAIFGKEASKGGASPENVGKLGNDLGKELGKKVGEILKDIEKQKEEEECGPDTKIPLNLTGAEDPKITTACFKFTVTGKSSDPKAKILLCLNKKGDHIDISKGYGKPQVPALFKLIDEKNLWGKKVKFFAMETTDGKPDDVTKSNVVELRTPVAPFKGTISYTGLGADSTLKYTGNGKGRLLSYTKINGWYFFKYGGKFERTPAMRGFDCITYVGTANKVSSGMSARGDTLANKLGASQVDMEDKTATEITTFFSGDGRSGTYIGWWSTHCFVIINGTVHDWSPNADGYRTTRAASFGWRATGNYVRQL